MRQICYICYIVFSIDAVVSFHFITIYRGAALFSKAQAVLSLLACKRTRIASAYQPFSEYEGADPSADKVKNSFHAALTKQINRICCRVAMDSVFSSNSLIK